MRGTKPTKCPATTDPIKSPLNDCHDGYSRTGETYQNIRRTTRSVAVYSSSPQKGAKPSMCRMKRSRPPVHGHHWWQQGYCRRVLLVLGGCALRWSIQRNKLRQTTETHTRSVGFVLLRGESRLHCFLRSMLGLLSARRSGSSHEPRQNNCGGG